jgi:hypothetical protein
MPRDDRASDHSLVARRRWLRKVSIKERIAELKGRAAEKCDMTREQTDKDPSYVRVPAGTTFYLYVTQTVDLGKAAVGLSASIPPPTNPTHP